LTENAARDDRQSGPGPSLAGQGSRDGLTVGLELVLTPVLFALVGWGLDRWFGSAPVLLVTFFVLVLAYEVWKLTARYRADMDDEQRRLLGGGK
jgi:F0F1-type ATP synthase assembly protein I